MKKSIKVGEDQETLISAFKHYRLSFVSSGETGVLFNFEIMLFFFSFPKLLTQGTLIKCFGPAERILAVKELGREFKEIC